MKHANIIMNLGGTFAVAKLLNVQPPTVSRWKTNSSIPKDKLVRLAVIAEGRGIATRQEIVPNWREIWPELAAQFPQAAQAAEAEVQA